MTRKNLIIYIVSLLLISLTALKYINLYRDSAVYYMMISSGLVNFSTMEPSFVLITNFNNMLFHNNIIMLFIIYGVLGVTTKIYAINKLSSIPLLSVFLYICLLFPLHEMTQIRIGVASGVLLLSILDVYNKRVYSFVIKVIIASLFHYSAIVFIVVYFFNVSKLNKVTYLLIPFLGILIMLINANQLVVDFSYFIKEFMPSYILNRIDLYLNQRGVTNFNTFNLYYISLILINSFIIINIKNVNSKYTILLVKIMSIGIFLFYALSFFPVLSYRLSIIFSMVNIILIIELTYFFKQSNIIKFLIVSYGLYYLYYSLFVNKLTVLSNLI